MSNSAIASSNHSLTKMKKAGRKMLHLGNRLNSTLQPLMPRSQSTLALQRKGSTPLRVIRDVRESRVTDKHNVLDRTKGFNRSQPNLQEVQGDEQNAMNPAQRASIPHRHRLSVDGTIGLQALIQEQIRNPSPVPKGKVPSRSRPKAVAGSSKELLRFIKSTSPSNQTYSSVPHADLSESSLEPVAPRLPRANSRTRLRLSNTHSLAAEQPDAPKTIQKLAYRTQTGSINGKPKRNNQDSFVICQDYGGVKHQWLFGVFDGHGLNGHDVSAHIKKSLPQHFLQYLSKNNKSLTEEEIRALSMGFSSSFLQVNTELLRATHIDSTLSGSTSVSVFVKGDLVLCANAGDSRAIVGRQRSNDSWVAIPLSKDHKPDDPVERARIEQSGGRVEPYQGTVHLDPSGVYIGPARVWNKREQVPGLAMSRSMGDFIASEIGVTAEPEVTRLNLGREDKFIVLASDGIWEFISSQAVLSTQCVEFIAPFWPTGNADAACDRLVREAISCWKRVTIIQEDDVVDDITVIIAFFLP